MKSYEKQRKQIATKWTPTKLIGEYLNPYLENLKIL